MRVLFDHGTPAPLAKALQGHIVRFAKSEGWDTFSNGALLAAAEAAGFQVFVTTDDQALSDAARDARLLHKAFGRPMASWQDGQVVWIQPEEIQIDGPGEAPDSDQ